MTTDAIEILPVIQSYSIELRRAGHEFLGICPFHQDRHPSMSVNQEKNVFVCRSCGEGGDAIRFVERIEGVDFNAAIKRLGIKSFRPSPDLLRVQNEAKEIVAWARETAKKIQDALRDIGDKASIVKLVRSVEGANHELFDEEKSRLGREWSILSDLDDDLSEAKTAVELWKMRHDIEAFADSL